MLPLSKWNDSSLYGINYKNIILILLIYIEDMIGFVATISTIAHVNYIVFLTILYDLLRLYQNRDPSLLSDLTDLLIDFLGNRQSQYQIYHLIFTKELLGLALTSRQRDT